MSYYIRLKKLCSENLSLTGIVKLCSLWRREWLYRRRGGYRGLSICSSLTPVTVRKSERFSKLHSSTSCSGGQEQRPHLATRMRASYSQSQSAAETAPTSKGGIEQTGHHRGAADHVQRPNGESGGLQNIQSIHGLGCLSHRDCRVRWG